MIKISVWYIILAIFVFGFLIFIHEFGHFLCAKAFGVGIKEFSIGMGPKIAKWKSQESGTQFALGVLPIGGYVSMVGEDEESDSENSFNNKPVWQRLLIVLAGPIMNLLIGFIVMIILLNTVGNLYSNTIYYDNTANAVTQSYGIQDGDTILKVGNTKVHTWYEINYEITNQGFEPIDITIERSGEKLVIENVVFPTDQSSGVVFGIADFYPRVEEFNFINLLKHSFFCSASTVKMVIDSFIDLFRGRYGIEAMTGPVGLTQTIGNFASRGLYSFLNIFVIITINLGVFNLFTIPALDGGRILFLLIELVIGRKLNPKVEGYINFVSFLLLLGLALVVTFNDIIRLF